jgi:N-formylglutamate deformylase
VITYSLVLIKCYEGTDRIGRIKLPDPYPFLISVPHGGITVPDEVKNRIALSQKELSYYGDPATRILYDFRGRVSGFIDTPVSRMVVDLNRPPYHLAPKYPDGAIKSETGYGAPVYHEGQFPDIDTIHQLMVQYFFPYQEEADQIIDERGIQMAFDCHCMLPRGLPRQHDAGMERPAICLSNNGDLWGNPRKGVLATCHADWIQALAMAFRREFEGYGEVTFNTPFSGGFISIAHHWHRFTPWVQIEVNRTLYEETSPLPGMPGKIDEKKLTLLRERIWKALTEFWDEIQN